MRSNKPKRSCLPSFALSSFLSSPPFSSLLPFFTSRGDGMRLRALHILVKCSDCATEPHLQPLQPYPPSDLSHVHMFSSVSREARICFLLFVLFCSFEDCITQGNYVLTNIIYVCVKNLGAQRTIVTQACKPSTWQGKGRKQRLRSLRPTLSR